MFFQAEDGIRDLVRSRGLGDVYKRQVIERCGSRLGHQFGRVKQVSDTVVELDRREKLLPVSYTHLTLPTSDLV